jgi:hypothetical protein
LIALDWYEGAEMETQVIEGTFAEVKQQFGALNLNPETHLRVIVTETEKSCTHEEFFANAPRRGGLIMVPANDLVTTEIVQEALYRADLADVLGDDRVEQMTPGQSERSEVGTAKRSE